MPEQNSLAWRGPSRTFRPHEPPTSFRVWASGGVQVQASVCAQGWESILGHQPDLSCRGNRKLMSGCQTLAGRVEQGKRSPLIPSPLPAPVFSLGCWEARCCRWEHVEEWGETSIQNIIIEGYGFQEQAAPDHPAMQPENGDGFLVRFSKQSFPFLRAVTAKCLPNTFLLSDFNFSGLFWQIFVTMFYFLSCCGPTFKIDFCPANFGLKKSPFWGRFGTCNQHSYCFNFPANVSKITNCFQGCNWQNFITGLFWQKVVIHSHILLFFFWPNDCINKISRFFCQILSKMSSSQGCSDKKLSIFIFSGFSRQFSSWFFLMVALPIFRQIFHWLWCFCPLFLFC